MGEGVGTEHLTFTLYTLLETCKGPGVYWWCKEAGLPDMSHAPAGYAIVSFTESGAKIVAKRINEAKGCEVCKVVKATVTVEN